MYGQHETLDEAYSRIQNRFASTSIDDDLKRWAAEQLDAVQTDLDLVTRGRLGYEDFLLTFIGREEDRYTADTVDDTHHDSVREQPLCTCDDLGCELKRGQLPLAVRDAEDLGRGIREFKQEHNGDPLVLDHDGDPGGARQAWSDKRARVWRVLRRLDTYFTQEQDGVPDLDPDADADATATAAGGA
jgi:hypothetical protein